MFQTQTEGMVFWTRYQMQCVGLGETRSTTIGFCMHKSTSSIDSQRPHEGDS